MRSTVRDSTVFNWTLNQKLLLAASALLAIGFYLFVSARVFRIGFPLDDTWIHLTYARNLAEHGEWAFRLGEHSAGSTSPVWTILLALGFILHLGPYIWTYFLGWITLTLVSIQAENLAHRIVPAYQSKIPWVGLFFVWAWHLTWAATSGMETLLHGLLILTVLGELANDSRDYLKLGLLAGVSVWVRPDGLTLIGPILLAALLNEQSISAKWQAFIRVLVGFGALFGLFLLFNLWIEGTPMPNTFYAKQAEFRAFWLSKSLGERVTNYLFPLIASPFLALLPGLFIWIKSMWTKRNWGALAGLIWFIGYVGIYFLRLPAYQHGRYIIPAFPILYLWSICGMLMYKSSKTASQRVVFIWQVLAGLLCVMFTFVAARQNAYDVYWIESEMVTTAKWVQENIPPDARLAVHDIGALGYYVPNPIIDLAGLITPEVVPFIRDERRLEQYLSESSADYLVVFISDYPNLTKIREPVFTAGLTYDPVGIDNDMRVYRLR